MFSAANDTLLPVRSRRGRDDRAAGEKKLHVGDAAGRPNNAVWAQGRMQGGRGNPPTHRTRTRNAREGDARRGAVREPQAPPLPEKD